MFRLHYNPPRWLYGVKVSISGCRPEDGVSITPTAAIKIADWSKSYDAPLSKEKNGSITHIRCQKKIHIMKANISPSIQAHIQGDSLKGKFFQKKQKKLNIIYKHGILYV